jgi:hypothetical protein
MADEGRRPNTDSGARKLISKPKDLGRQSPCPQDRQFKSFQLQMVSGSNRQCRNTKDGIFQQLMRRLRHEWKGRYGE